MEENQNQVQPKKPVFKKWWFWAIAIVLVIAIASSGSEDVQQTSGPTGSNQTNQTQTETPAQPEKTNYIKAGMYKVGNDIPAGEYVIIGSGYFQVTKDSSGSFDSIICNDNFENRTIISVKDGQYLTIQSGKTYPANEAPKVEESGGILPAGMYKVGADLQPGEYKVKSPGDGYIEVSKDSSHSLASIVSNDNFTGEKYITVKAGQYIKLQRAELILR